MNISNWFSRVGPWIDAKWLAVFLVGAYCIITLAPSGTAGPLGSRDLFFIFGGATRIAMGQIPHQDFSSPLGFLFFWPAAQLIKMHLTPDRAFDVSFLFFNALAVISALFLSRGEPDRWLRALVIIAVFATVGSLSDNGFEMNPAVIFWRQFPAGTVYGGYRPLSAGLTGLILFRFFYEPLDASNRREIIDGVFTGALAVLVLFIKPSYAVMGALPVLVMLVLFPAKRTLIITAGLTALVLLAALEWGGHHYVTGLAQDVHVVAQTGSRCCLRDFAPRYLKTSASIILFLIIGLASLVLWRTARQGRWRTQILLLSCLASNLLIAQYDTNWQHLTSYLAVFPAIGQMLAKMADSPERHGRLLRRVYYTLIILLIVARLDVHIAGVFGGAREGIAGETLSPIQLAAADPRKYSESQVALSVFRPYYETCRKEGLDFDPCLQRFLKENEASHGRNAISQLQYLQTGADLLERARKQEDIHDVLTLDFSNPFDSLLGITPAKALPLWIDPTTLSRSCYPAPDKFFSRAAYVLQPLYPMLTLYVGDLEDIYGDYLGKHFAVLDQNEQFILWKRARPAEIQAPRYDCTRQH
jgi:hypothetical protein